MIGHEYPYNPPSGFLRSTNLTRFYSVGLELYEKWQWYPSKNRWELLGTKTEAEWEAEARCFTYGY